MRLLLTSSRAGRETGLRRRLRKELPQATRQAPLIAESKKGNKKKTFRLNPNVVRETALRGGKEKEELLEALGVHSEYVGRFRITTRRIANRRNPGSKAQRPAVLDADVFISDSGRTPLHRLPDRCQGSLANLANTLTIGLTLSSVIAA